jgi:hypothetical protein
MEQRFVIRTGLESLGKLCSLSNASCRSSSELEALAITFLSAARLAAKRLTVLVRLFSRAIIDFFAISVPLPIS